MRNVWAFIAAVFGFWVALMSGIASLAFAIWLDRTGWTSIPSKAFWAIGIALIFVAFYRAWRNEHSKVEALQKSLQYRLAGSISDMASVELNGRTVIIIRAKIRNLSRPTIVDNYQVSIETTSKMVKGTMHIPNQDTVLYLPDGNALSLLRSECILERTSSSLGSGAEVSGYLLLSVDDMCPTDIYGSVITLRFRDVEGNEYPVTWNAPQMKHDGPLPHVTGMTNIPIQTDSQSPQSPKRGP
jgi:hypothetical protein